LSAGKAVINIEITKRPLSDCTLQKEELEILKLRILDFKNRE